MRRIPMAAIAVSAILAATSFTGGAQARDYGWYGYRDGYGYGYRDGYRHRYFYRYHRYHDGYGYRHHRYRDYRW